MWIKFVQKFAVTNTYDRKLKVKDYSFFMHPLRIYSLFLVKYVNIKQTNFIKIFALNYAVHLLPYEKFISEIFMNIIIEYLWNILIFFPKNIKIFHTQFCTNNIKEVSCEVKLKKIDLMHIK